MKIPNNKPVINEGIITPDQELEMVIELKYDGISVEADCTDQVLSARTRGDTGIGQASDITPLLYGYKFLRNEVLKDREVGVKFEAIMTKTNLQRFNFDRQRSYVNCRSAIVGLFGASDGYKYRDMSQKEGISISGIASRLRRARMKLKLVLIEGGKSIWVIF